MTPCYGHTRETLLSNNFNVFNRSADSFKTISEIDFFSIGLSTNFFAETAIPPPSSPVTWLVSCLAAPQSSPVSIRSLLFTTAFNRLR